MLVSSRSSSYTPWTRTFVSSKMHIKCSLMIGCVWGIAKNVRLDLTLLAIDLYHEDLQLILLIWYYLPLCYKLQPRTCQRKKCLLWMEDFHARAFQSCTSHTQLFKGQCEKTMRTFIHLNDSVFWHCWFKLKIEKSEFVLVGGNFGEDFQMYPSTTTGDSFSDLRSWERWPWRWQRVQSGPDFGGSERAWLSGQSLYDDKQRLRVASTESQIIFHRNSSGWLSKLPLWQSPGVLAAVSFALSISCSLVQWSLSNRTNLVWSLNLVC